MRTHVQGERHRVLKISNIEKNAVSSITVATMAEKEEDKFKTDHEGIGWELPADVYTKEVVSGARKRLRKLLEEAEQRWDAVWRRRRCCCILEGQQEHYNG